MSANTTDRRRVGDSTSTENRAQRRLLAPGSRRWPGVLVAHAVVVGEKHHHIGEGLDSRVTNGCTSSSPNCRTETRCAERGDRLITEENSNWCWRRHLSSAARVPGSTRLGQIEAGGLGAMVGRGRAEVEHGAPCRSDRGEVTRFAGPRVLAPRQTRHQRTPDEATRGQLTACAAGFCTWLTKVVATWRCARAAKQTGRRVAEKRVSSRLAGDGREAREK